MNEITTDQVLAALRHVRPPHRDEDVVTLGMVSGIVIKNGNVGFALEVHPAEAPRLEPMRKACEQAVRALPGVLSATAEGNRLEYVVDHAGKRLPEILRHLTELGVAVRDVSVAEPTLESVFIELAR